MVNLLSKQTSSRTEKIGVIFIHKSIRRTSHVPPVPPKMKKRKPNKMQKTQLLRDSETSTKILHSLSQQIKKRAYLEHGFSDHAVMTSNIKREKERLCMPLLIAIVKSLRWPGAFTVSNKGEVDLVSLLAVSTLAMV